MRHGVSSLIGMCCTRARSGAIVHSAMTGEFRPVDAIVVSREAARELACSMFEAYGVPARSAATVADHLVENSMMGVHSHGMIRLPQYVDEILQGEIDPAATPAVARRRDAIAYIAGNRCFGHLAASLAAAEAIPAARAHGMSLALVRRTGHAGRIGAYTERIARRGLIALSFCSGPRAGHRVAPFGGKEARLATNPISYAVPTRDAPIVADFSTAVAPEGRIRFLKARGLSAPPGTLLDARGVPTTDPGVLYDEPKGVILPFGGLELGYRGFALSLLVECMATLLPGDDTPDESRYGNNLAFIAIVPEPGFTDRVQRMVEYVRSAEPIDAARPVLLPGEPERIARRHARGVPIDRETWSSIERLAAAKSLRLPDTIASDAV
jgi:hydroxycarboxylate dehydrogenase B